MPKRSKLEGTEYQSLIDKFYEDPNVTLNCPGCSLPISSRSTMRNHAIDHLFGASQIYPIKKVALTGDDDTNMSIDHIDSDNNDIMNGIYLFIIIYFIII
jgi:hypothetical protein